MRKIIKLCMDCKHAIPDTDYLKKREVVYKWIFFRREIEMQNPIRAFMFAKCAKFSKISLVNGQMEVEYHCSTAREIESKCGNEAKLFEPREPQYILD